MSASWLGAPPGGCPAPTRPRPSTRQCARWCVPRCSRAARSLVPVPVLQADTTYHRCARAYRTRPTSCRRRSRSASTSGRACCSTRSPTTIRRAAWWPLTCRRCRATRRTRRRGRGPRGQPATGWQVPSKWLSVLRTVFGVITVRGMDMSACDVIACACSMRSRTSARSTALLPQVRLLRGGAAQCRRGAAQCGGSARASGRSK